MGDYPKAIENYMRGALECVIDGRRGDFLGQALRVAFRSGDKAAFKQVVQKIAELPRDKSYELLNGYVEAVTSLLEGQPAEAERRLKELRPKLDAAFLKDMKGSLYKPYFPRWNTLMSLAKVGQGKTDEAIALNEELINPPIPWGSFEGRRYVYEARARLAELLARKGDLDRAEKLLAENHRWNPDWAPTKPAEEVVSQLRREKVLAATR